MNKMDEPDDESEIILGHSKFSWCQVNQCKGTDNTGACPGQLQHWHHEKRGRKNLIVYTNVWRKCPCKCHGKVDKSKVVKTRRPRRRKS